MSLARGSSPRPGGFHGRHEALKALRRERGQQRGGILEMMRRRRMRDPRALGQPRNVKPSTPFLRELRLGSDEQRRAQVAVMIGGRARRAFASNWSDSSTESAASLRLSWMRNTLSSPRSASQS